MDIDLTGATGKHIRIKFKRMSGAWGPMMGEIRFGLKMVPPFLVINESNSTPTKKSLSPAPFQQVVLIVLLRRATIWLTLNNTTGELSGTAPEKFTGNFQPDVYEGLELWLSADNAPGGEGDTIYKWPDDSGNDYHADNVQGNPTLKVSALNGHSVIAFDGSDELLWTSHNFDGLANGYTLFTVARYAGNPKNRVIGSKNSETGSGVFITQVLISGTLRVGFLTIAGVTLIGIYIVVI